MNRSRIRAASLVASASCVFAFSSADCIAVLGNAWHIPDNPESCLGGTTMRNPTYEIGSNTAVYIYQGVDKSDGANQTNGAVFYRSISGSSTSGWSSVPLGFNNDCGSNQYWTNSINTGSFGTNDVIQYYVRADFSNRDTTYLFGRDTLSMSSGAETNAQANPYSFRNRPAWIFHAGNRVVSGQNVQFWAKVGYISKDDTLKWADSGRIYYTTDGSTPGGSNGVPTGTTQVVPMNFDHRENDTSIAGNDMWWVGTAPNLPTFTTIKYKIGLWHSSNNEEKIADYNTSGTNNTVFSFSLGNVGDPVLTIDGLNANYTTTHLFVNELAGDSVPLTILFQPGIGGVQAAEVYSNLNRRNAVTNLFNGIEEGIQPPDGNTITTNDLNHYYRAYTMSATGTPGEYSLTLNATNTGAYRLTARAKVAGTNVWYTNIALNRRDHAIVVSPKKARDIVMYELNTLNVESTGTLEGQRSAFVDLWDGPGATHTNLWSLTYIRGLGVNWLWFQPIHPQGVDGRQIDPDTMQPYEVGSPYAVKNFFEVSPLMSQANTRPAAMNEFTNFVAAADSAGVNIMLDAAFNHTAYDCELGGSGVSLFATNAMPTSEIRSNEARVYSRVNDYCQRATSANDIAVAPDRGDFGKFNDVKDIYFGRYAALVCQNPQDNGNHLNEGDWFDYTDPNWTGVDFVQGTVTNNITRNVWKYFADYILYWLDKTGCPAGTPASQSFKGLDGLRADFGQGLPPQAWEYIMNKARSRKWDFVFMAETLDGGNPGYRSNRHFDILNENIIFALEQFPITATALRGIFEQRRQSYGQGLVLLNTVSHDEHNYIDPFEALVRYAACATIDGVPMIFYGQELGISRTYGFDRYESNFGKVIPHFKKYNSMIPIWNDTNFGLDQLYPVYSAVNFARRSSPALRSSNRFFLNQTSGSAHEQILSVAKFQTPNAAPTTSDVVFAFVNLDRNNDQTGTFNVNITQNGSNLFGIKSNRTYNVKNISAYSALDSTRSNQFLWGNPGFVGSNVLANGVFVQLRQVPGADQFWTNFPYEAQCLKVFDVTPPPAAGTPGGGTPAGSNFYVVTNSVTFSWLPAIDPEGGVTGYRVIVGTSCSNSSITNVTVGNVTSFSVTGSFGQTLFARIAAINGVGIEGPTNCNATGVVLLDPAADQDGDGMSNGNEDTAATNPFDATSLLHVTKVVRLLNGDTELTWSSVVGKRYVVQSTESLQVSYADLPGTNTATGASSSYTNSVAVPARFYRVKLVP